MKVSLVIPAYNVEGLIEMTLESVRNQTLKEFECIIVNDYSTDNTLEVIKNFIKSDKRFKLVSHRANAGLSAARNTGLRFAKGRYVAFLDADDLIMPESLELRSRTLDNTHDDNVIGTYAASVAIDMNCKTPPLSKPVKLKNIDFITAGGNCPFNANQPMFIRELFMKFGGFDHSLKQAEDYDMWMRILRYGYRILCTHHQLVTYRQTEGSMIKKNPLLHLEVSYKRFMDCYMKYPKIMFNSKFNTNLTNGLGDYTSQLNISNRVLEFVGLGLAKGEEKNFLVKKLNEYLPDYFDILEVHRAFKPRIKKGIDRYYGINVDLSSNKFSKLNGLLEDLYEDYKTTNNSKQLSINHQLTNVEYTFENIVALPGIQRNIDLVFLPHKDYHVYTISLLKPYFDQERINIIIVDISMHYRDEGVKKACEKYNIPFIGYSNFLLGDFKPKGLVCFNDWDPIVRSILIEAKKVNISTIGIVEGIQDYLDADTKQDRQAYRVVDHLFLPGEHDKKYFKTSNQQLYVGGIPRIPDLYAKRKKEETKDKIALINSNFSYGVLEEYRDEWLTNAVNACKKAGFKPVISRHPADKGKLFPSLISDESFYSLLEKSTVHISRFASGVLEALAMNVLPIYFNPHGEKVDKFNDSLGAYPVVNTEGELQKSLNDYEKDIQSYKKNFNSFLEFHCGRFTSNLSENIVNKINEIIKNSMNIAQDNYDEFYIQLNKLDQKSGCFNNLQTVRKNNEEKLNQGATPYHKATLKLVHHQLKLKNYPSAEKLIDELLTKEPNNPAYISAAKTISILGDI